MIGTPALSIHDLRKMARYRRRARMMTPTSSSSNMLTI
jgi:hypothetical protein